MIMMIGRDFSKKRMQIVKMGDKKGRGAVVEVGFKFLWCEWKKEYSLVEDDDCFSLSCWVALDGSGDYEIVGFGISQFYEAKYNVERGES